MKAFWTGFVGFAIGCVVYTAALVFNNWVIQVLGIGDDEALVLARLLTVMFWGGCSLIVTVVTMAITERWADGTHGAHETDGARP